MVVCVGTAICMEEQDPGPCRGYFSRWYFDANKGMCVPFTYGGCRGNRNNFERREDCSNTCELLARGEFLSTHRWALLSLRHFSLFGESMQLSSYYFYSFIIPAHALLHCENKTKNQMAEIRASHSRLPWIRPVISAVLRYALPHNLSNHCLDEPMADCRLITLAILCPSSRGTPP